MGRDKWDGMGERLRQAIKDRGFINSKGDADITRFALTHNWIPNYLYRWVSNAATPDKTNLLKLGAILRMSPAELLGDEVSKVPTNPRKRGARKIGCLVAALGLSTATAMVPPEVEPHICSASMHNQTRIPLIGSWRLHRWIPRPGRAFPDLRAAWAA